MQSKFRSNDGQFRKLPNYSWLADHPEVGQNSQYNRVYQDLGLRFWEKVF